MSISLSMLSIINRLYVRRSRQNKTIECSTIFLSFVYVFPTHTAQPMHWIYSPDKLKEILSDLEPCPEFRPQSANPFYRRMTGEQTCYGDQAYVLLESLSQCGGSEIHPNRQELCHMLT